MTAGEIINFCVDFEFFPSNWFQSRWLMNSMEWFARTFSSVCHFWKDSVIQCRGISLEMLQSILQINIRGNKTMYRNELPQLPWPRSTVSTCFVEKGRRSSIDAKPFPETVNNYILINTWVWFVRIHLSPFDWTSIQFSRRPFRTDSHFGIRSSDNMKEEKIAPEFPTKFDERKKKSTHIKLQLAHRRKVCNTMCARSARIKHSHLNGAKEEKKNFRKFYLKFPNKISIDR